MEVIAECDIMFGCVRHSQQCVSFTLSVLF